MYVFSVAVVPTTLAVMAVLTAHCKTCPTRQHCLGAGLDGARLHALGECLRPSTPHRRGDHLYRVNDPADGCFIVRSGIYKTFAINPAGEEYVTGFFYPGDLLGLPGLADGAREESAMAVETATACRVRAVALPALWSLGGGTSLLRLLGRHDQRAITARITLSQNKADCRVAHFLLDLSERMGARGRDPLVLPAPMTRTDLASYLGMTLESLSRVFSRLTRAGLISTTRREVTLRAPERLQALAWDGRLDGHSNGTLEGTAQPVRPRLDEPTRRASAVG